MLLVLCSKHFAGEYRPVLGEVLGDRLLLSYCAFSFWLKQHINTQLAHAHAHARTRIFNLHTLQIKSNKSAQRIMRF